MLLRIEDQLAENLYDQISGIVLTMAAKKTWDASCADMFKKLEKILTKKKYKTGSYMLLGASIFFVNFFSSTFFLN